MGSSADGTLQFFTDSTEKVRITPAGNVGIGTTDPGANKLKVDGATEITGNLTVGGNIMQKGYSIPGCKKYTALNNGQTTVDIRACKSAHPCHIQLFGHYFDANGAHNLDLSEGSFIQDGYLWKSTYLRSVTGFTEDIGTNGDTTQTRLFQTDGHGSNNYCTVYDDYTGENTAENVVLKSSYDGQVGHQMKCTLVVCSTTGGLP